MNARSWLTIPLLLMCLAVPMLGKAASVDTDKSLRLLAIRICINYSASGMNVAKDSRRDIVNHIKKHEGISHPSVAQMVTFLNHNKDKMTCGKGKNKKNYMMVAFDRGAYRGLYRDLFVKQLTPKDKSVLIDINAVSYNGPNGAPITVLDYMNGKLADPRNTDGFKKEIERLKRLFSKKFGAKTFAQLPKAEQQRYLEK